MYSRILIAVDSSEYSLNAARKGVELARQLHAETAFIFVIDVARTIHSADTGIFPEEAKVILIKEAEQTLDQLSRMFEVKDALKFMPEGHPAEDIINTARTWGADLVVMGTHGRTGLMHLLTGSIAEDVLRHAPVPVLVVPTPKHS